MTFPQVYFSIKWALPPVVVRSQQEADQLEPTEWAALAAPKEPAAPYPKLFLNVNVPPRIVVSADQEEDLSAEWRDFTSVAVAVAEARPPDVPPVTLNPASGIFSAAGGTDQFTVTFSGEGISGTWIATKDSSATWLTFSPETPQSANGSVTYAAALNTSGAARVGHIYVNGKTFTVNQDSVG
jgi:hypothetical protein